MDELDVLLTNYPIGHPFRVWFRGDEREGFRAVAAAAFHADGHAGMFGVCIFFRDRAEAAAHHACTLNARIPQGEQAMRGNLYNVFWWIRAHAFGASIVAFGQEILNSKRSPGSMSIQTRRSSVIVLPILWLGLIALSRATPQSGDALNYEGETIYVHGFKLSKELETKKTKIEESRDYHVALSSNWDGFYVKLLIEDNRLYLTEFCILADPRQFKDGVQVVPLGKPRLFAAWFSGELLRYYGRNLGYTEQKGTVLRYKFDKGILTGTQEEVLHDGDSKRSQDTQRPPRIPEELRAAKFNELMSRAVKETQTEQPGAGQPANRPVDEPEGREKPQPEAEGRSR